MSGVSNLPVELETCIVLSGPIRNLSSMPVLSAAAGEEGVGPHEASGWDYMKDNGDLFRHTILADCRPSRPIFDTGTPFRFKWTEFQLHISDDGPFLKDLHVLE